MEAPKKPRSSLCRKHSSRLDIYCCTDEQIICAECASAEHSGHTIGLVREERRRKQKELKTVQLMTRQILEKQEKKQKGMGKTLELIQEEAIKTKDHCECILVGVIDSLQKHYLSVRGMIESLEASTAAQIQTSLRGLQVKMEEMKKMNDEMDRLALADDVHFLEYWPSLKQLCMKDHLQPSEEVSEDTLLSFALTKSAVEKLGRQLKQLFDDEFASIYQSAERGEQQESGEETEVDDMQQRYEPDTSESKGLPDTNATETDQDGEPKTRADFLQYACGLTFDQRTAHEDLVISAGDKEVRLSPQTFKSSAVRYPERFLHRRQVLCREGLQAEHCYYEVEITGGNKVEIALAYKSIDRKSRMSVSAFGANEKSWSLDRSTNYSVSHKADSIQLTTPPTQKRIGVYLKFKEGTVSFYEVSDTMKFLYTVEAEFKEPLYPGFWLGEDCRIRICDL
ncbi:tripartite motif-containing protein 16-like [Cheilinus undulatus]|uniref:tripartite motif-containing protein 16-like n=1 Tax=Cheilinus undulatus TaxID=241271 RepID=UPI001BD239E6|nr:tripartite motif-containing protein 16-like [Cheilinus undulatus]